MEKSGESRYHYGSKEEVEGRLEDGYHPTESHFSQIRPARPGKLGKHAHHDTKPDEFNGRGQGMRGPFHHNGNGGRP